MNVLQAFVWIMCHVQFVLFTTVVARNEKIQLTTKVTKSTKFGDLVIRTLRVLRDLRGEHVLSALVAAAPRGVLRGENIFTVNPEEPK